MQMQMQRNQRASHQSEAAATRTNSYTPSRASRAYSVELSGVEKLLSHAEGGAAASSVATPPFTRPASQAKGREAASTPPTPDSCTPTELHHQAPPFGAAAARRSVGHASDVGEAFRAATPGPSPTPPPPRSSSRSSSRLGKERPSIIAHRIKQRDAEELAHSRTGEARRQSFRQAPPRLGDGTIGSTLPSDKQWGDYGVTLRPTHPLPRAPAESRLMVLVKPDDEGVSFREHVKLKCNRQCDTVATNDDDDAPPVHTSIASIEGKHPHTCRVNVHGTNTTVDADMALETDAYTTKLNIEFYDVEHKVQLNVCATVYLGQEAIKAEEMRKQGIEAREEEREDMLEMWRRNEEVREAAHKEFLRKESLRQAEIEQLRDEFARIRALDVQREQELAALQERDVQREREREKEREAERAHEKLRMAEREQIRFREREREQERAREQLRAKEREEEAAAWELELEQVAIERQIREEERIEEREREAQRRHEQHQEKLRDVQWREEFKRLLKMQHLCPVCEKRCRDEELAETERRVAAAREEEARRGASELAQAKAQEEAQVQGAAAIDLKLPTVATPHHPCNSEVPSLLFPQGVVVDLPAFGHAIIHVEITSGYKNGDVIEILSDANKVAAPPDRVLRVLPGEGKRVVEDPRNFNNHVAVVTEGEPYYPASHAALRMVCANEVAAVRTALDGLAFRTASHHRGPRVVSVVILVEPAVGQTTRVVKRTLQQTVHVLNEVFACARGRSITAKERGRGSVALFVDPKVAVPVMPGTDAPGSFFEHDVACDIIQADDAEPMLMSYGVYKSEDLAKEAAAKSPEAVSPARAGKRSPPPQSIKNDKEATPAAQTKNGGLYLYGKRVAVVERGLRGDGRDRRVRVVFNAPVRADVVQHVLGRMHVKAADDGETASRTCWVVISSRLPDGRGVWENAVAVRLTFVAAESRARLIVNDPALSYRFTQHRRTPDAQPQWLQVLKTAQLRTPADCFKNAQEYFQGGFMETLIVAGSKKGDELAFQPDASLGLTMKDNKVLRHDVKIATLDPPGLLGAKCCKLQFTEETSFSLEDLEALLQSIFYRTVHSDQSVVGTRSIGTYITLGNRTLEGQVLLHIGQPTVTGPAAPLTEAQIEKPLNISEDLDAPDEVHGYANVAIDARVVEGDFNCSLDVGVGLMDDMVFRNVSRTEILLEEGLVIADADRADWTQMRLLSMSSNSTDFAALVLSRPGRLFIRFRRNPEEPVQMLSPMTPGTVLSSSGDHGEGLQRSPSSTSSKQGSSRTSMMSRSSIASSRAASRRGMRGMQAGGGRGGGARRVGNGAAERNVAAARATFLKDEFKAVLARIYHTSDPENPPAPGCTEVKICVSVTDALGGESHILRSVNVVPRPRPSFQFASKYLAFYQQCGQYSQRQWQRLAAVGKSDPFAYDRSGELAIVKNQIVFGQTMHINDDLVPETNDVWKLSAEIVAGKDARDTLTAIPFEPEEDMQIDDQGKIRIDGCVVAAVYTKGAKLLVDFNQIATRRNLRSIMRALAFKSDAETLPTGERRVAVCFQQRGLEPCTQTLCVEVMNAIISGPDQIGVVYALGSGYHYCLARTTVGLPPDEPVTQGRISIQFVDPASPGDEIGLDIDHRLWRVNDADELWSTGAEKRRLCKLVRTPTSLMLVFTVDGADTQATGADLKDILARVYYAHWSDSPSRHMRRLRVLVAAGGSLQCVTANIAIQPVADTIAVVLQKTSLDFLLKGSPVYLAPAVRVLLPSGDRLSGQCNLIVSLHGVYNQFDLLHFNIPKKFAPGAAVRACDRGQLYFRTPSGREVKIGAIQKEKTSVKGISVRLESPPANAIEGLLQTVQYTCSRPNLKDRGTERQVQFLLKSPYFDSQRVIMTVRLVGPILDAASCGPRKYNGEPLALLPHVQVSRDCFASGCFEARMTDMDGALTVMPEDILTIALSPDEKDLYREEHPDGDASTCAFLSRGLDDRVVARASGIGTDSIAVDFYHALPQHATAIIRAVTYGLTPQGGDEAPFVSVAVKLRLVDEYSNECEGVVHIDS